MTDKEAGAKREWSLLHTSVHGFYLIALRLFNSKFLKINKHITIITKISKISTV